MVSMFIWVLLVNLQEIELAPSYPMSETVCLLSLAVRFPSKSFSLLRKNMGLRHHDPFVVPEKDPSPEAWCPQASPRRQEQRGWKRGGDVSIPNAPISSFFHGLKEISYQSDTCISSPSWERVSVPLLWLRWWLASKTSVRYLSFFFNCEF